MGVKRIALVVENYYPSMSGVPVVMQYLAEGLVNEKYDVDVLTCGYVNGEKATRFEVHNGVNIFRYYISNSPLYKIIGEENEKEEFLKKACSDVYDCVIVTCAQCWSTNILLPKLRYIKGMKIFYTHGYSGLSFKIETDKGVKTFVGSVYRYLWMKRYYRLMPKYLAEFDKVVYISQNDSAKDFGDMHGIKHGYVIDNAVEDVFFEENYVKDKSKKYLLNVSNYTYVKNQERLLEAFYIADTDDYSLILIGSVETEYTKRLYKLKRDFESKYGEKDVKILYKIDRSMIHKYVRDAFAFVMSSTWEQYSIALCEAMAEKVPFISTDVGNARFLPGGIIANTKEEIANAISDLIAHPEKAEKLGEIGHEFALKHNKRNVAIDSLIKLIET